MPSEIEVDEKIYNLVSSKNSYWSIDASLDSVTCDVKSFLSSNSLEQNEDNNLIKGYDNAKKDLAYIDVELILKVSEPDGSGRILRAESAITEVEDTENNKQDEGIFEDRDSKVAEWSGKNENKIYQDDEDYESVILNKASLRITQFVIGISNDINFEDGEFVSKDTTSKDIGTEKNPYTRATKINTQSLKDGNGTQIDYFINQIPLEVPEQAYILYNIRVYNEGGIDTFAGEITERLPNNLDFITGELNDKYEWKFGKDRKTITTSYLSHENSSQNIIEAFTKENDNGDGSELKYKEIQLLCRVSKETQSGEELTSTAEITKYEDKDGNEIAKESDIKAYETIESKKIKSNQAKANAYSYEEEKTNNSDRQHFFVYLAIFIGSIVSIIMILIFIKKFKKR